MYPYVFPVPNFGSIKSSPNSNGRCFGFSGTKTLAPSRRSKTYLAVGRQLENDGVLGPPRDDRRALPVERRNEGRLGRPAAGVEVHEAVLRERHVLLDELLGDAVVTALLEDRRKAWLQRSFRKSMYTTRPCLRSSVSSASPFRRWSQVASLAVHIAYVSAVLTSACMEPMPPCVLR